MEELVQLVIKSYGLVGLFILAPMVALSYLWRRNNKLDADISRIQELRVNDAKAIAEKMMEIAIEQSATSKETSIALDQVRELLGKITANPRRP